MIKLIKYSENQETYMFPSGKIATPDVIAQNYPGVKAFTHVLEINGDVCQAIQNLKSLRNFHNIDESLTEDEAIKEIEYKINNPVIEEPETTAEERIAAAMEFQNLMALNNMDM